jgi:hypothetical protein
LPRNGHAPARNRADRAALGLVAVPEPVAVRVPSAQPYSHAVHDNRVYLVDPSTNIIVAEINR